MRDRLRAELGTGELLCDRMGPDTNGGYTWRVTFQGYPAKKFQNWGQGRWLMGRHVEVRVRRLNEPMLNMRKGVAVYTRPVADLALGNPEWVQQAIVAPASHQGSDLFGAHQPCVAHSLLFLPQIVTLCQLVQIQEARLCSILIFFL